MSDRIRVSYYLQNFGVFLILLSYMRFGGIFGLGIVFGFVPLIYRYYKFKIKPDFLALDPMKFLLYILVYLGCLLLSAILGNHNSNAWQNILQIVNYMRPFFLILFLVNDKKEFYYGVLLAVLLTCAKWVFLSENSLIDYFKNHKKENLGPFPNRNVYVMYLNLVIPVVLVNILNKNLYIKVSCIITTLYLIIANLSTLSRGGFLALIAILGVFSLLQLSSWKKRIIVLGTFLGCLFILINMVDLKVFNRIERTGYAHDLERVELWKSSIKMFEDHPLTGVGVGNFNQEYRENYMSSLAKNKNLARAHNMWLTSLAETGLIGTLGLCILVYHFIYYSFKNRNKGVYRFNLAIFLIFIGMLVHGLVDDIWVDQYSRILWIFWVVAIGEGNLKGSEDFST